MARSASPGETIARLETNFRRDPVIRDVLENYRQARALARQGFSWGDVSSGRIGAAFSGEVMTRAQVRNLLIRKTYRLAERAMRKPDVSATSSAATLTASFLQTLFPGVCDDATPERVLKVVGRLLDAEAQGR